MSIMPSDAGPRVDALMEEHVVLFTWKGSATHDGLAAAQTMVDAELKRTGFPCVLADLRGLENFPISFSALQALARMHGSFSALSGVRIGVIATDPSARGLVRAYQMVSKTRERLKIFSTSEQAMKWVCG